MEGGDLLNYSVQAQAAARWFDSIRHDPDCVSQLGGTLYDMCDCEAGRRQVMDHNLVIGRIVHAVNRDSKGQKCNPAMVIEVSDNPEVPIKVRVFTAYGSGYAVAAYHSHIYRHRHTWHWPDECDEFRYPREVEVPIRSWSEVPITLNPGKYLVMVDSLGHVTYKPLPDDYS